MPDATWDVLLRRARVFDGGGGPPQTLDIAVRDGRIAARGVDLPPQAAARVIDVDGHWLMPGLLDIHTHLDLEVDLDPRLPEVVRHGTTTVLFGNCSLGTCFGHQRDGNGQDPIVDCFTRVENIPKSVLAKCVDAIDWDNSGDYMEHFKRLPLGPNVASFVPHSMLRVEAMGLEAAISAQADGGGARAHGNAPRGGHAAGLPRPVHGRPAVSLPGQRAAHGQAHPDAVRELR
jgi:N-acyl-D-aspartate/D-glutamate deacylase